MKQIIVVKPNSVSEESKKLLKEENCILIEHENPSEVRVICLTEGLEGDDLFNSMVETIQMQGYSVKGELSDRFLKKIQKKQDK